MFSCSCVNGFSLSPQNSVAHVTMAMSVKLDDKLNVIDKPALVYGGVNNTEVSKLKPNQTLSIPESSDSPKTPPFQNQTC